MNTSLSHYELLEELGRGAFAVVYCARDTKLNREVALKVLNAALTQDPQFAELFIKEARTVASLDHPNIVTLFEADQSDDGRLYLAMKLLGGLNLRRRIERDGQLPLPLVVSVIEQIASALSYAHSRGIVHRDVKSANIIVDEEGKATLTDFGLVRAVESSTYGSSLSFSGGFAGTVEYMSPEQVEGEKATAKSDLYGLGIVAYEMLTGTVPFKADTPLAVIRMQADKPPRDPKELRPDLPAPMRDAILKALAKKPNQRQKDVMAFAKELREGLGLKIAPAKPPRSTLPPDDITPIVKPNKGSKSLIFTALIVLGVVFALCILSSFALMQLIPSKTTEVNSTVNAQSAQVATVNAQIATVKAQPPQQVTVQIPAPVTVQIPVTVQVSITAPPTVSVATTVASTAGQTSVIISTSPQDSLANANPNPIYTENFSTPKFWNEFSTSTGWGRVENASFVITSKDVDNIEWTFGGTKFGNTYTTVVTRIPDGKCKAFDNYGLIFRYKNNANFYLFGISCDGTYRLLRRVDGVFETIIDFTKSNSINPLGQRNILGVRAVSDNLSLYVNDKFLSTVKGAQFADGLIGFYVAPRLTPNMTVVFDDVEVYEIK